MQLSRLTYTGLDYFLSIPARELLEFGSDVIDALNVREKARKEGR